MELNSFVFSFHLKFLSVLHSLDLKQMQKSTFIIAAEVSPVWPKTALCCVFFFHLVKFNISFFDCLYGE